MRWFTFSRISGRQSSPYLTRITVGERFRIHWFHREDLDPDPHDHSYGFWTFPLKPYLEEVHTDDLDIPPRLQIVPAFKWSYRPAEYRHRVLSKTLTLVWRDLSQPERDWFFYRNGFPIPWQTYLKLSPDAPTPWDAPTPEEAKTNADTDTGRTRPASDA